MRRSPAEQANQHLLEVQARVNESNGEWLTRSKIKDGIILLGGASLGDFRVRVAQSSFRSDMMPSFWSNCGILLDGGSLVASVPMDLQNTFTVPKCNGVRVCQIDEYDDPVIYPNIAIIKFAKAHANVERDIRRLQGDRSILDVPALMLPWIGYIWGVSSFPNPLVDGVGVPGAAFVETVFAMAGFELTPGLSSASTCPEAIWQSAKWWTDYYAGVVADTRSASSRRTSETRRTQNRDAVEQEERALAVKEIEVSPAVPMLPSGVYVIRQKAAAAVDM